MRKIKIILWKEFIDLSRDWRTIISTILLPLIILPLLGLMAFTLTKEQVTQIIIIDEDQGVVTIGNNTISSINLTSIIESIANERNMAVVLASNYTKAVKENPYFDVVLIIPKGFIWNATSLNDTAQLRVIIRVGSARAAEALNAIGDAIERFNDILGRMKIEYLSKLARIKVSYESIRNPVKLSAPEYTGIGGQPASIVDELRAYTAKILMFALLFIAPPISSFISDTITGEKERKTLESLLATPVPRLQLLAGKMFAATILGALAALADIIGVVGYFYILALSYGGILPFLDLQLILVHSIVVFMTSLLTASMVLPLVLRSKTMRGAQASSTAITSIAMIVYFAVLFVDIPKLPPLILSILYLIPFTHPALIVYNYVNDQVFQALIHALLTIIISILLMITSTKLFQSEKILASK